MASQEINERQLVDAEFHQFSRLPPELRETIWRFALPAQRPFEIIIRINDQRKVTLFVVSMCVYELAVVVLVRDTNLRPFLFTFSTSIFCDKSAASPPSG
jgi:hypothetical protein